MFAICGSNLSVPFVRSDCSCSASTAQTQITTQTQEMGRRHTAKTGGSRPPPASVRSAQTSRSAAPTKAVSNRTRAQKVDSDNESGSDDDNDKMLSFERKRKGKGAQQDSDDDDEEAVFDLGLNDDDDDDDDEEEEVSRMGDEGGVRRLRILVHLILFSH